MATGQEPTIELNTAQAASSGIEGLDLILRGGFVRDEMHLVQGGAGTGKTTLALQFLLAGVMAGERGLCITLSQTKKGLEAIARSHGWSLEGLTVHELSPSSDAASGAAHQTVLHTSEVELGELTRELRERVEQAKPRRVVFDSLGVIALLAGGSPRYHREIVILRQFLTGHGCTALFLDDAPAEPDAGGRANPEFHSLATSMIHMEQTVPDYGEVRRRVRIVKVRGVAFRGGYHNFRILTGGLQVFPRIEPPLTSEYSDFQPVRSGIKPLDGLLGGGLEQGTTCLLVGPSGAGKSTLAGVFAHAAAQRGDSAAVFLFDERPETWKTRAKGVGMDLQPHVDSHRISLDLLDPAQITPGEFAQRVSDAVDRRGVKIVVIDSLTGYFNAMGNATMLVVQMHELITFLSRRGVLTLLLIAQEGFMSVGTKLPLDVSYLSDTIIVLRLFEAEGAVRRCLAAVKKRQGEHETTIRELFITPGGVRIGEEPLRQFRHILGGDPEPAFAVQGEGNGSGNAGNKERLGSA